MSVRVSCINSSHVPGGVPMRDRRLNSVGLFVCFGCLMGVSAGAQNVSVLNSATRTGNLRAGETAGTQPVIEVAVPVAASSDLGGEGQRGVAPTVGFQVWQKDRFFIG